MSPGWGAQSCGGRGRGHFPPFPAAAFRRQALRPVPCPSPPTNLLPDPTSLPWLPAPGCCCRWLPPAARPQRGRRAQRVTCSAPNIRPTPSACSLSRLTAAPAWPSPTTGPCAHFSTQVGRVVGGGAGAPIGQRGRARAVCRQAVVGCGGCRQHHHAVGTQCPVCPLPPPPLLVQPPRCCRREGTQARSPLLQVPGRALPRFPQGASRRRLLLPARFPALAAPAACSSCSTPPLQPFAH